MTTFATGAVRSSDVQKYAYHLMSPIGMKRWAATCQEGKEKYSSYNWEAGIPITDILDHAMGHIVAYLSGDRSEDHLGHLIWNAAAACHSEELWPHLNKDLRTEGCKPPCDSPSPAATGR